MRCPTCGTENPRRGIVAAGDEDRARRALTRCMAVFEEMSSIRELERARVLAAEVA
ncbi:MAG: hypothetical protein ACRDI0_03100 [Actinomycetota bacterium]